MKPYLIAGIATGLILSIGLFAGIYYRAPLAKVQPLFAESTLPQCDGLATATETFGVSGPDVALPDMSLFAAKPSNMPCWLDIYVSARQEGDLFVWKRSTQPLPDSWVVRINIVEPSSSPTPTPTPTPTPARVPTSVVITDNAGNTLPLNGTSIRNGTSMQLKARVLDQTGAVMPGVNVTSWGSSQPSYASVSNTGLVRGKKIGAVRIWANYNLTTVRTYINLKIIP